MPNCNCITGYTYTPSTPTGCANCINMGTIVVPEADYPDPCGGAGTADLSCFCFDGCTDETMTFSVESITPAAAITVSSITETTLTYTTAAETAGGTLVTVIIKGYCSNGLADYGTIYFYTNNLCAGVVCPDGQVCEDCTGNCIDDEIDLEVS